MTAEIKDAKYSEIETLMTKDVAVSPSEPIVWIGLARAEPGLKNYLDAETNFKKALDLESRMESRSRSLWVQPRPVWAKSMPAR